MPFSPAVKEEAKRRAHYTCVWCRRPGFVEVHHIIPQNEGGPDTIENACTLCPSCHTDYGGNPERRSFLREMRDWWWEQCKQRESAPATIDLNRKMDAFFSTFSTATHSLDEIKQFLYSNLTERAAEILKAQSLGELGSASGVSLPPPKGTVYVFGPPLGPFPEDKK